MYLSFAYVEITISFSLEHRVAGYNWRPSLFFLRGHTIIDYNTNTITRITSTIIRYQYGITEYKSVPIREWLPTVDHYSLRIWCSICFCNNQEFYIHHTLLSSISNRPWINLFGWLPSTWFDNFFLRSFLSYLF